MTDRVVGQILPHTVVVAVASTGILLSRIVTLCIFVSTTSRADHQRIRLCLPLRPTERRLYPASMLLSNDLMVSRGRSHLERVGLDRSGSATKRIVSAWTMSGSRQ